MRSETTSAASTVGGQGRTTVTERATNGHPLGVDTLSSPDDVIARYRLPGPHVTAVINAFAPTDRRGDLHARWPATRTDLRHLGAPATALDRLDEIVAALPMRDQDVLVSATEDSAVVCWLTLGAPELNVVGPRPALLAALDELAAEQTAIGAIVDRVGADLFRLDRLDRHAIGVVDGDEEHIHRGLAGGSAQPRYQRHSELVWERNAELVAEELRRRAAECGAEVAVITGDERATGFVSDHLGAAHTPAVDVVGAGGRHEPSSPDRLHSAARDVLRRRHAVRLDALRARVLEELGQRDRATAGLASVREAVDAHRAGTVVIDRDHALRAASGIGAYDEIVAGAFASGADVLVDRGLDVADGIGALLRYTAS